MTDLRPEAAGTALELRERLVDGRLDLAAYYEELLAHTPVVDQGIRALAALDERVVRLQVAHRQSERHRGEPLGRLYGVPVVVSDVVDTVDFPTAFGSAIHQGRYPVSDAVVVRRLREAGAVILGKSATTAFAAPAAGPARNPHDPTRTAGEAAGGSAAAVSAGLVPVALAAQANASTLLSASFCGVYGLKPSRGLVPRTGVFEQSPTLDEIGVFARSIDDLALVTEILSGDDGSDPACNGQPPRRLAEVCAGDPPVQPRFCFVRTPWWDRLDAEAREACDALVELMDGVVVEAALPSVVEQAVGWMHTVSDAELAFALQREYHHHRPRLDPSLCERIERGAQLPVIDYLTARDRIAHVASAFDEYFEHYDAILTPAALGAAPAGPDVIGDPVLQGVWSFGGLPAMSMPLLQLSNGMPLGIQAVGRLHNDGRMLRACRWLVQEFITRGHG